MVRSNAVFTDWYNAVAFPTTGEKTYDIDVTKQAQVLRMAILGLDGKPTSALDVSQPILVELDFVAHEPLEAMNVSFMLHENIEHRPGDPPYVSATHTAMTEDVPTSWSVGTHRVQMEFPGGILNRGRYYVRVGLGWIDGTRFDKHADEGLALDLTVAGKIRPHDIHSHGLLAVIPTYRTGLSTQSPKTGTAMPQVRD